MLASSLGFRIAVLFVLTGMAIGIGMAASHDHSLMPAHAHINLIGWVTLFLISLFYERRPQLDKSASARWQVIVYTGGAVVATMGITLLLLSHAGAEPAAALGSVVLLAAMAWFALLVYRSRAEG